MGKARERRGEKVGEELGRQGHGRPWKGGEAHLRLGVVADPEEFPLPVEA